MEVDKWLLDRKIKISKQLEQLKIKQKQEHQALLQKIEIGQDEQKKTRASELEKFLFSILILNFLFFIRLLQKYQNVKKEMSNQHVSDLTRLEKNLKNPSTLSVSKFYGSRYLGNNSRFSALKEGGNPKDQQESP